MYLHAEVIHGRVGGDEGEGGGGVPFVGSHVQGGGPSV